MSEEGNVQLLSYLIGPILAHDESDRRFELFANELVSMMEGGVAVLPTSKSWDLGRDGRGLARRFEIAVASSLTDRIEPKMRSDLERMAPFLSGQARLFFCTPLHLSDHAKQGIEVSLREIVQNVSILVLSEVQLVHLATKSPEVFLRHYAAEYAEAKRAITETDSPSDDGTEALRLVLGVVGTSESDAVRQELYDALLLDFLHKTPATISQISNGISASIGLGRSLPEHLISELSRRLKSADLIDESGGRWFLTSEGRDAILHRQQLAAGQIIEGRQLFRNALETELGSSLVDEHFNKIWAEVRSTLAVAFYERGNQMVAMLSSIISPANVGDGESPHELSEPEEDSGLPAFVADLAARVAGTTSLERQKEELSTAIKDIFADPNSGISEWLISLCAKFVMLCSLGVEHQSGASIAAVLGKVSLVFDTDVAISLLCVGEPQHEAAETIASRWPRIGARMYVAAPVLAEVAHHAWISEFDSRNAQSWLTASREDRAKYIENAFVRAFAELMARKKARPQDWSRYIRDFKGEDPDDYRNVAAVFLRDFKGFELLPELAPEEIALRDQVYDFAAAAARGDARSRKIALDKAKRDSELYASMMGFLRLERRRSPEANCILVSSARRLTQIEGRFKRAGEQHLVLSIGAVIYLLSMVPGVSIGLGAMETFLFEGRGVRFGNEIERKVMRLIASSKEYRPLGFARRAGLVRDLKDRLFEIADRSTNVTKDEAALALLKKADSSDDVARRVSGLIKESLDALAVDSKTEVELRQTKAKLAEAERKIEVLLDEKRKPPKKDKPKSQD